MWLLAAGRGAPLRIRSTAAMTSLRNETPTRRADWTAAGPTSTANRPSYASKQLSPRYSGSALYCAQNDRADAANARLLDDQLAASATNSAAAASHRHRDHAALVDRRPPRSGIANTVQTPSCPRPALPLRASDESQVGLR